MRTPAFDLQVNGYAGVDFNDDGLTLDALRHACDRLAADGVEAVLAAVITADPARMLARIERLTALRAQDQLVQRIVTGIHVEGPFLNPAPGFAGAHPSEHTRNADVGLVGELLDAGAGLVRLFTLAPERDPRHAVVQACRARQVTVAAGHTDASHDQLARAIDAGLSVFTHLGNGCPTRLDRHDNIVQRALSLADRLWCCFVGDGAHVPFFALGNYLRCAGLERCVLVTDAISAAGLGPGRHPFAGRMVQVGPDLVPRADDGDHLVGSAATMPRVIENLRREFGFGDREVELLCRRNPRRAIGLDGDDRA